MTMSSQNETTNGMTEMTEMAEVAFYVPGRPVPERRHRAVIVTGDRRSIRQVRSQGVEAWKHKVAAYAAATVDRRPLFPQQPVELTVVFQFRAPKALKQLPTPHTVRPDVTNLVKVVEDALTGIVWSDDRQVVHVDARKEYGQTEGVWIRVKEAVTDA